MIPAEINYADIPGDTDDELVTGPLFWKGCCWAAAIEFTAIGLLSLVVFAWQWVMS